MQKPSRAERGLTANTLYDFQPAILLTNKRINSEARRFLYDDNMFVLVRSNLKNHLGVLRTSGLTLLAAKEDETRFFRSSLRIAIHVDLDLRYTGWENDPLESRFVIAAHELWHFCKILDRFDNQWQIFPQLHVTLGIFPYCQQDVDSSGITGLSKPMVWGSRPFPEQRMLLEPFGTLHSLKNLDITSVDGKTERIDAQLIKCIKERAGRLLPSIEELMVTTTNIEDQGNEAFHTGDLVQAASLYKSARKNLKAGYYWTADDFPEHSVICVHHRLKLRIMSKLIAVLLRLQLWSKASKKTTKGIKEITITKHVAGGTLYDTGELAKLYYQMALASEGMGDLSQAVEQIREALRFHPTNMEMKAKLEKWATSAKQVQEAP